MLDHPWWRFALSGTLISVFCVVSWLARRHAPAGVVLFVPAGMVGHVVHFFALLVFYHFIGVDGGPVLGGWANLGGIGLVLAACGFRWLTRRGSAIPYPGTVARIGFDMALAVALGTAWGGLALVTPAVLVAMWAARRHRRGVGAALEAGSQS